MTFEEFYQESKSISRSKKKYGIDYSEFFLVNAEKGIKTSFVSFLSEEYNLLNSYIIELVEAFLNSDKGNKLKITFISYSVGILSFLIEMYIDSRKIFKAFNFDVSRGEFLYPSLLLKICGLKPRHIKRFIKRVGKYTHDFDSLYLSQDSVKLFAREKKNGEYELFKIKIT